MAVKLLACLRDGYCAPPARAEPAHDDSLASRLARLARLEIELALAESKAFVNRVAMTLAVAVPCVIALLAAIVVLIAGGIAPLFDAVWQHLVIAGGAAFVLALAGLGWSAWRITHLHWPTETLASFEENWRWLAAQLRSRLTLR